MANGGVQRRDAQDSSPVVPGLLDQGRFQRALEGARAGVPPAAAGGAMRGLLGAVRSGLPVAAGVGTFATVMFWTRPTPPRVEQLSVLGQPGLGARFEGPPGARSGTVTIFTTRADGQPGRELAVVDASPEGELRAPPGSPDDRTVLGHVENGRVQLEPGVGEALAEEAARPEPEPAAGAGGNGVRTLDGECDSWDGGPSRSRLPRSNGYWDGVRGQSNWHSTLDEVNRITGGQPISFRDGQPDFTPYARVSFEVPAGRLTGTFMGDVRAVSKQLQERFNLRNNREVIDFLISNNLTLHHATPTCLQLVPEALNNLVPHIGSASFLREAPRP